MLIVLEASRLQKVYRAIGIFIIRRTFCLTLLWFYNERYDSGKGLFRLQVGQFIEYKGKVGIRIEGLGFSYIWLKKDSELVNEL